MSLFEIKGWWLGYYNKGNYVTRKIIISLVSPYLQDKEKIILTKFITYCLFG